MDLIKTFAILALFILIFLFDFRNVMFYVLLIILLLVYVLPVIVIFFIEIIKLFQNKKTEHEKQLERDDDKRFLVGFFMVIFLGLSSILIFTSDTIEFLKPLILLIIIILSIQLFLKFAKKNR